MFRTNIELLIIALFFTSKIYCYGNEPVKPSKGSVWPKPQIIKTFLSCSIKPSEFKFKIVQHSCFLLHEALKRYSNIISIPEKREEELVQPTDKQILSALNINLLTQCEDGDFPYFEMNESYTLNTSPNYEDKWTLTAPYIWGILRGLETFSQLIYFQEDALLIKSVYIEDYPKYKYRGLLLDTSRHFLPVNIILENLDAMAYNKLNVFHWHIVDDPSFPYQSITFPELSERGAFHPSLVYTHEDVNMIIEYARLRGIRVIPEFDTPSHSRSWGKGIENILTTCINKHYKVENGPMDPTNEYLYGFLEKFFLEVTNHFPDKYLHLGGDEVEIYCWNHSHILNFMEKLSMNCYESLQNYYMERLFELLKKFKKTFIVWEEVFNTGAKLPKNTVVQVWTGSHMLEKTTSAGYKSIYSACWYLDIITRGPDWYEFYKCNADNFLTTDAQRRKLIGGEACMWGESVNEHNVLSRIWPRASAVAEILWSENADYLTTAAERLEEHACRMSRRGIPTQSANGPGFCLTFEKTEPYVTKIRKLRHVDERKFLDYLKFQPFICSVDEISRQDSVNMGIKMLYYFIPLKIFIGILLEFF